MALSSGGASDKRLNILGSKVSSANKRHMTADFEVKTYALSDRQSSIFLRQ